MVVPSEAPLIALSMMLKFIVLSASPEIAAVAPPVAMAAVVGIAIAIAAGQLGSGILDDGVVASPVYNAPELFFAAMTELVVPLATTVVIVQKGQGIAVLQAAGYKPGVNLAAATSGLVSLPMALIGNVTSCLTGPTNALIVSGPNKQRHYTAAMVTGLAQSVSGSLRPSLLVSCWPCRRPLLRRWRASQCLRR